MKAFSIKHMILIIFSVLFLLHQNTSSSFVILLSIFSCFILLKNFEIRYPALVGCKLPLAFLIGTLIYFKSNLGSSGSPVGLSYLLLPLIALAWQNSPAKTLSDFLRVASSIFYFPILIAGPVVKIQDLFQQIYSKKTIQPLDVQMGLVYLTNGVFKKSLANFIAPYSLNIHYAYNSTPSVALFYSTLFLIAELYADFSGYSDMAIGISKILGIHLPANFSTPYFATNMAEFWRRWHISLGDWFTHNFFSPVFIYFKRKIPHLKSPELYLIVTTLTMVLIGLWHQISLKFLAWGLFNGLLIVYSPLLSEFLKNRLKCPTFILIFLNLGFIWLSFLIFRSSELHDFFGYVTNAFDINFLQAFSGRYFYLSAYLALGLILPQVLDHFLLKTNWLVTSLFLVYLTLVFHSQPLPFIYAQF